MVIEIKMIIQLYEGNVKRVVRPGEVWVHKAFVYELNLGVIIRWVVQVFLPWKVLLKE